MGFQSPRSQAWYLMQHQLQPGSGFTDAIVLHCTGAFSVRDQFPVPIASPDAATTGPRFPPLRYGSQVRDDHHRDAFSFHVNLRLFACRRIIPGFYIASIACSDQAEQLCII
jgi:hypothetical protein